MIEYAIEPLRVFVRTTRPNVRLLSIHGDADLAVSQWGHGEHQDNAEVRAYNAHLADPILIRRSPANMHSMNACESKARAGIFLYPRALRGAGGASSYACSSRGASWWLT